MPRQLTLATFVATVALFSAAAFGQDVPPTAYIGDDLPGLRAAIAKQPDNLGLRMRLVHRLLATAENAEEVRQSRDAFAQVEKEIEALRELGPEFPYPYRVLSRLYYRREEHAKLRDLIDEFAAIAMPDQEMRSLYVKSLLRSRGETLAAEGDETPAADAGRDYEREAAEYVGNWFDSIDAPGFGKTLGSVAVWLVDEDFRDDLVDVFAERYARDPANLNLVISYAACLAALGRNESAWKLVHDAERIGLCDTITGARHPIAYMLALHCPEGSEATSYAGMDVDELDRLMREHPENVSFPLRAALVLKRRGDVHTLVAKRRERQLEELAASPASPARDQAMERFRADRAEYEASAKESYEKALPYAVKTQEMSPELLAVPLLLGDIHYRLGDLDAAVRSFEEGVQRLPLFTDLREGLARVYVDRQEWEKAAANLAELTRYAPCDAASWDTEAETSIEPVPALERERLMLTLIEVPEARRALTEAIEKVVAEDPKNPNPRSYLAMIGYFADDEAAATRHMLEAERAGLCGEAGFEHRLATLIYSRSAW